MGKNISNFYYVETETNTGELVYDNINILNKRNICNEEFIKMLNSGNICEHDRESYDDKYDTEVIAGEEKQDENLRSYIPVTIKVYNKQEYGSNVYKSTQNIYKIPIIRNRIMLTDNKYKMSDVYPNNYNTMLEPANELNTRKLTTTRSMFYNCSKMKKLNTSNFNTSNVVNMSEMFSDCPSLTTLDVSKWDTSNVTNMGYMFYRCRALTSLNLNNFKVNENTNISGIISGCTSLTPSTLKMDSFKNIKFKNAGALCEELKSQEMIDYILGIIDLSENKNFNYMFRSCQSLTTLDISKWNTSNATEMSEMFRDCQSLTSLDVSNFNTSNVTDMSGMFSFCSSLTTLDVSKWNTSKVRYFCSYFTQGMFRGCSSLTSLDISNWDTSNAINMDLMFEGCTNLTTITGIIDMKSCTNYNGMFRKCNKLTGVKLKNVPKDFNASKAGLKEGQYTIVS